MRNSLLSCFLLLGLCAAAQAPDSHLLAPRTRPIVSRSAFAHGYLHGYEEGFHQGDLDLHMARAYRDLDRFKEAAKAIGYRRDFGDRSFYDHGYRQGYRVGYADGIGGRSFRAVDEIQQLSLQFPTTTDAPAPGQHPHPSREYDSGFAAGYEAGQHLGLADARVSRASAALEPNCPVTSAQQAEFCTAYGQGYRMGYSDGYTNQAHNAVVQAAK